MTFRNWCVCGDKADVSAVAPIEFNTAVIGALVTNAGREKIIELIKINSRSLDDSDTVSLSLFIRAF